MAKQKKMILLQQNQANNVYLTLSEKVTLTGSPVYFLFRFKNLTTKDVVLFTAPDSSTAITNFNQFTITLTGSSLNYTAGTISLHPDGKWQYDCYEMTGQTNLFVSGTTGTILETGIVKVSGTNLSDVSYLYDGLSAQTLFYLEP